MTPAGSSQSAPVVVKMTITGTAVVATKAPGQHQRLSICRDHKNHTSAMCMIIILVESRLNWQSPSTPHASPARAEVWGVFHDF